MIVFTWNSTEESDTHAKMFECKEAAVNFFEELRVSNIPSDVWVKHEENTLFRWNPLSWYVAYK